MSLSIHIFFSENHHQNINRRVYKTPQVPHLIMQELDPGKLKDSEKQRIMPLVQAALWIKCPLPHHPLQFHGNSTLLKIKTGSHPAGNPGQKLLKLLGIKPWNSSHPSAYILLLQPN